MPKFSKILILIFLILLISIGFTISHFSKAEMGEDNIFASNVSNSQNPRNSNSLQPAVYICPNATSLEEVNPKCSGIIILDLGETTNGMTLIPTTYNGQEYYLVLGFTNGGGGVAHRTQLTYDGDLSGQYSDSVNLSAILTDKNGNPLSNKSVVFEIGNQSTSTITNGDGIATTSLVLSQIPGKYYFVDATFSGDENYLPSFDSKPFEIFKENVVINIPDKEGFASDTTTLEAEIKDDDGELLHQENGSGYFVEFKVATTTIGTSTIDEYGKAKVDWNVNLIPKEVIEKYPITAIFVGNNFYNPAEDQATFTLKSAKWLKQDAVDELEAAKTGDKKIDQRIDKIIWLINQSLDEKLWQDASHLIFFEKGFENLNENEFEEMFDKPEWTGPRTGIIVFHFEKTAVRLMMEEIKSKKTPNELKQVFEEVIQKLVKADQLSTKISLFDAKNTSIQNPRFQKIVEHQIKKAEEELIKAEKELSKNRPDKAISRLAKSWLHFDKQKLLDF